MMLHDCSTSFSVESASNMFERPLITIDYQVLLGIRLIYVAKGRMQIKVYILTRHGLSFHCKFKRKSLNNDENCFFCFI